MRFKGKIDIKAIPCCIQRLRNVYNFYYDCIEDFAISIDFFLMELNLHVQLVFGFEIQDQNFNYIQKVFVFLYENYYAQNNVLDLINHHKKKSNSN